MMESMFYVLCTTIPIHITVFTLYWRYSWRSKKLAFFISAIVGRRCCKWV